MKLLVLLMTIGCASFPSLEPQEICAIDFQRGLKYCAMFDFSYGKVAMVGEVYDVPIDINTINKHLCESPKTWEAKIDYLKRIYLWKDKYFKDEENSYEVSKKNPLVLINETN